MDACFEESTEICGYVRYTHLSDTDNTQLYRDAQNVISLSRSTEQTATLISPFHPLSRF